MRQIVTAAVAVSLAIAPVAAHGATGSFAPLGDESENYSVEMVLAGLDRPGGVVLRASSAKAGPHELFLAENGAGRIIRIATDRPRKTSEVIVGLSKNSLEGEFFSQIGPVGLAFLTRTKLAVGGGGQGAVGVYLLPDDGSAVAADEADHTVGASSNGAFFALTKSDTTLFMTGANEDQGWIFQSEIEANRLATLGSFATTKKSGTLGMATGIAISPSPRPPFLVVAYLGDLETRQDSTISFYVSSSATMAMNLGTGLHDIVALAYSPTGQLYAVDFASEKEEASGVYRLDDARVNGQQACQAVKIASIPRPISMVFTPDGMLYVTALGASDSKKQGILVKITGEF
ncbi:MAG: hypothetical protein GXP28_05130 [Planctomycetes bacterium]|nr:hypothetical protein [Planctomycetota bacterium]